MALIYLITKPLDFGCPLDPRHIIACRTTLHAAQEEHKTICIAAGDTHAAYIRGPYTDETELEAFCMLNNGMQLLTAKELVKELDALGYRISARDSFSYFNGSNERHYKARHINIVQKSDGIGFANIAARKDENFKALQRLRFYSFGWHNGRIWEL